MILHLQGNDQILKDAGPIDLNDFTVLTGENGSGKTQLLQWILNACQGMVRDYSRFGGIYDDENKILENAVYVSPGLNYIDGNENNLVNDLTTSWGILRPIVMALSLTRHIKYQNLEEEVAALNQVILEFFRSHAIGNLATNLMHFQNDIVKIQEHKLKYVKDLCDKSNKAPSDLTINDYIVFLDVLNELFSPSIQLLFYQFYLKNKYYNHLTSGKKAPWVVFNEILERANFKYRVVYETPMNEDYIPQVQLKDVENGNLIYFLFLSSGEKTIMSLIFALYSSTIGGNFPQLILFDEPDSLLHPSMSKLLLDVIQDVIVGANGVKVIMTTHSPTTIALVPESAIYLMDREKGYPIKIGKKKAIKSLTAGLNNLNLLYEDKRQVFVESNIDFIVYNSIYSLISDKLLQDVSLTFVSTGKEDGGCEKVKRFTKELLSAGNKYVAGIIDNDSGNVSYDNIKVLGENKRYSIENYLFEPFFLGIFLLLEKVIDKEKIGFKETDKISKISGIDNDQMQTVSEKVTGLLKIKADHELLVEGLSECKMINGFKILVPNWILNYPGHRLEELVKDAFPFFKKPEYKNDGFKKKILEDVFEEFPEFISIEFLELFTQLQRIDVS
ncbi:AAA family ATPase [Dyadobacter sp. 3J3]|uniref:AAA family ATPase n=1 Tax=Dyadobacter sp. 3J3 TaxID=2606600 RepID=UPI0013575BB9|nr:AAA family ATPase [Dyadobacter sp. 3J3]